MSELLGGYRMRLPAYASSYHGDRNGGLYSKQAFADFAQQCYDLGYRAFKIKVGHPDVEWDLNRLKLVATTPGCSLTATEWDPTVLM